MIRDHDNKEETHYTLTLIERHFPVSLNIIVFHLLHRLPFHLKRFGPVHGFSMCSYERFNSWVSTRVKNRRYPESTVIQTYCLYKWANYLQMSGRIPPTFTLHSFDHIDGENNTEDLHLLSDNEVPQIQQYYCLFYPAYYDLCEVYKSEREKARNRHHLKHIPPMEEWIRSTGYPMTAIQQTMYVEKTEIFHK